MKTIVRIALAVALLASGTMAQTMAQEAGVVSRDRVNIRGKASIYGEVVAQLNKGDVVTILETITLTKPKAEEPTNWFRIALPSDVPVWVFASFINTNLEVVPKRLNLRAGPGENFSVLGRLNRGDVVKTIRASDDWLQIEASTNSYAFIAAEYVSPKLPETPVPGSMIVAVTPVPAPVVPAPVVAPIPADPTPPPPVVVEPPPVVVPPPAPVIAPAPVIPIPAPVVEPAVTEKPLLGKDKKLAKATTPKKPYNPMTMIIATEVPAPVKRVVTREGVVRMSYSLAAPAGYILEAVDTGRPINYLYTSTTNVILKPLKGKRVIITGEEGLDKRWPNTPVLTIQQIQESPEPVSAPEAKAN